MSKTAGLVGNSGQMKDAMIYGAGSITNSGDLYVAYLSTGVITNTGGMAGAALGGAGEIINDGGIGGEAVSAGVFLGAGGTLLNDGVISGFIGLGFGATHPVIMAQAGALVINDGYIDAYHGIQVQKGGTVIQSGTIATEVKIAISFSPGFANRLIVTPGAVFGGTGRYTNGGVYGGGGALELAAGSIAGTITVGTMFTGFDDVMVDAGAVWAFDGATSFGTAEPVVDNGSILLAGSTVFSLGGTLSGDGEIELGAATATLVAVAAGPTVAFTGSGETLQLGDPAAFGGTVADFAAGDTIVLAGVDIKLVKSVKLSKAGVLTVKEALRDYTITLANPAGYAGDTFAAAAEGTGIAITPQPPAQMAFLAPASQPAATAAALPVYAAPAAVPSYEPAGLLSAASAGWLSQNLITEPVHILANHVTFIT